MTNYEKASKTIIQLISNAGEQSDADRAMKFAQAATNAANALMTLNLIEAPKGSGTQMAN